MKGFTGIAIAMLGLSCFGATTNWIEAHPSFRVVRGRLYNVDKSTAWTSIVGNVAIVSNGIVIVRTQIKKEVPAVKPERRKSDWLGRMGAYSGGPIPTNQPKPRINYLFEPGPIIAVTNLPDFERIVDRRLDCRLLSVGRFQYSGEMIALYDYGEPHRIPAGWKPAQTNK